MQIQINNFSIFLIKSHTLHTPTVKKRLYPTSMFKPDRGNKTLNNE